MKKEKDPMDGDYVGNIFGWRLSLIGLVLIVALGSLAAYRHYVLDVPVGFDDPTTVPESKHYHHERAAQEKAAADSLRKQ